MSEINTVKPRRAKRSLAVPAIVAGGLSSLLLAFSLTPTFSALTASILDWARQNRVGFSSVVSVGPHSALEVADMLDFLAGDRNTQAILVYLEGISNARRFMSALRAAASSKAPLQPVMERAASLTRAGMDLENAVAHVAKQTRLDELHLLAAILRISVRYGGRVDVLMERVANFMRDREQAEQHAEVGRGPEVEQVPAVEPEPEQRQRRAHQQRQQHRQRPESAHGLPPRPVAIQRRRRGGADLE